MWFLGDTRVANYTSYMNLALFKRGTYICWMKFSQANSQQRRF